MRILFISFDADPPHKGGTARVVNLLAHYFLNKGHEVALGFMSSSETPSVFFRKKILLDKKNESEIKCFFAKNQFDIIYNCFAMDTDWELLNRYKGHAVVVSAYHNQPRLRFTAFRTVLLRLLDSDSFIALLHRVKECITQPVHKKTQLKKEKIKWNLLQENSDYLLLLSRGYIPRVLKIIPEFPKERIVTIPNPLVFPHKISEFEFFKKKKVVLTVVSSNYQKRCRIMFDVWRRLMKDSEFKDWTFKFVGGGLGIYFYQKLIRLFRINNIEFYPVQDPEKFYEEASIFMMTSRYEGMPMVLLEAMQMGCVPIVYNSFEALPEMIINSENGTVVPNNHIRKYVDELKQLMKNPKMRERMALNGLNSVEKFSMDRIGKLYIEAFIKMLNTKCV